jgi:hypothetical protein
MERGESIVGEVGGFFKYTIDINSLSRVSECRDQRFHFCFGPEQFLL